MIRRRITSDQILFRVRSAKLPRASELATIRIESAGRESNARILQTQLAVLDDAHTLVDVTPVEALEQENRPAQSVSLDAAVFRPDPCERAVFLQPDVQALQAAIFFAASSRACFGVTFLPTPPAQPLGRAAAST